MITTSEEYRNQLFEIQKMHSPQKAVLPYANKIYSIDVKSRNIDGPTFLSVLNDHSAINIYFSIQRYVDYMDLAETACVIQYRKPNGKMGIYAVPYYDIFTYNDYGNEKIVFSWLLNGNATALSGPIEYSIQFFKVSNDGKKFVYNLNTLPTTSTILNTLNVTSEDLDGELDIPPSHYQEILSKIAQLNNQDILWIEYKN